MDSHGQQSLEQKQYQSLQQQEEMPIIRPGPMNPQIVQPVGNSTRSLAPVDESVRETYLTIFSLKNLLDHNTILFFYLKPSVRLDSSVLSLLHFLFHDL